MPNEFNKSHKQIQSNNTIELLKENLLFTDNFSFPPPEMKFYFSGTNPVQSKQNTNPLNDISNNIIMNQSNKTKKENVNILQTVGIAERKALSNKVKVTAVVSNDENNENNENNISIVSPPSDIIGQSMEQIANTSINNKCHLSNNIHYKKIILFFVWISNFTRVITCRIPNMPFYTLFIIINTITYFYIFV